MAEKNTQSILESIKKKLNKFDQKTANKMSNLDDEFDYVASAKKEGEGRYESVLSQAAESEQVSELAQDSQSEINKENPALENLDLDDESSIKPIMEEVAAGSQNTDSYEEFEEEDLEDFEDEVDFAEDEDDLLEDDFLEDEFAEELEEMRAKASIETEENDDLNFGELTQSESKVEEESKEPLVEEEESDELNFDELTQAESEAEVNQKELVTEEEEEDEDLNFTELTEAKPAEVKQKEPVTVEEEEDDDDLDFDDLEFEEEVRKEQSQKAVEQPAEQDPHDDELDELEREIQKLKETAKEKSPKEAHLELEDELLGIKPAEVVASVVAPVPLAPEPERAAVPQEVSAPPKVELDNFSSFPELPPIQVQAAQEISNTQIFERRGVALDEATVKQTTESVKKLLDARNVVSGIANFSQSPILAELAMQMLEPKLEKWLNENLSQMVETVVREEIKKIISKE